LKKSGLSPAIPPARTIQLMNWASFGTIFEKRNTYITFT
jgi:hypothetical protein